MIKFVIWIICVRACMCVWMPMYACVHAYVHDCIAVFYVYTSVYLSIFEFQHSLQMLDALVNKWKMVSQQAIIRLHNLTQEPRPTLTQLIDHLNIDYEMIGYCVDEESFVCDQ